MSEDKNIRIARLIGLEKKAREARDKDELNFLVVNETREIINYTNSFLLLKSPTDKYHVNAISDIATVGYYYWKKGSDFVKYAEDMIDKNIRVNNEFYVCPVFNQAIIDNKQIRTFDINKMWGLGTPEDLKYFIENYK